MTKTANINNARYTATLIRCCDRCGCAGAVWVQTPGKVTAYGDDGWEAIHPNGCPD